MAKPKGTVHRTTEEIIDKLSEMRFKDFASTLSMITYLKENHKVKDAQAYNLINMMYEKNSERMQKTRTKVLEDATTKWEEILEFAKKNKDRKTIVAAQKELDLINGINKVQKVEVTVTEYKAKFDE